MKKAFLFLLIVTGISTQMCAQTWTKISNISDTVNIAAVTQINNRILISGQRKGTVTTNHFSSPDGNTGWEKLPTFSYAGSYLFGLPQNEILLGGGFLDCKKLVGNTWSTSFSGSGFAEFPDGTIIGGSANYPDSIYTYSASGVRGNKPIGKFTFKFGPKYTIGSNGRLFLYVYGSGFAYIDQADKSKLIFPAMLDGVNMTETSWQSLIIISDVAKLSDGTLIATNKVNTIFRSTDNGNSWTTVLNQNSAVGLAVEVNSEDEVFVIFDNKIFKSLDKGLTYSNITASLPGIKIDMFINSNDELFVVCNSNGSVANPASSGIYKYTDVSTGVLFATQRASFCKLYPNPTENEITLEIDANLTTGLFILYDINMKEIKNETLTQKQTKIDLGLLSKGLYIAQIILNGETQTQKIIIQ